MATLPARIRQNVRDHFTSLSCSLVVKTTQVTKTLGYPISIDPEWTMLWKTLQAHYPDTATFVPRIANTIIAWCDAFLPWLEHEENEGQVEMLLELLKSRSRLEIVLEVSATVTRPTTSWEKRKCFFIIALPNTHILHQHTSTAGFSTDLLNLFNPSPVLQPSQPAPNTALATDDTNDWADLDLGSPENQITSQPHVETRLKVGPEIGEDTMPEVSTIQRPEELTRRPPYWLIVRQEGSMRVTVQGSHAPSLACLDEYLRRWCRGDVSRLNRPPVVDIKLQESAFGLGLLHDTLTMEAIRGREVSAMLVLVFVENILGYVPVPSNGSAGSVWEFRRTKGFK